MNWLPIAAVAAGLTAAHAADPQEVWEQAIKAKGGRERLLSVHSLAIYMKPAPVNLRGRATNWLCVFPDRYFEYDGAGIGGSQRAIVVDAAADRAATDATGIPRNARHLTSYESDRLALNQIVFLLESAWLEPKPVEVRGHVLTVQAAGHRYRLSLDKGGLPVAALSRFPGRDASGACRIGGQHGRIDLGRRLRSRRQVQSETLRTHARSGQWSRAVEDAVRRALALALPIALLAIQSPRIVAQDEQPTFKAEVKVVNVLATVRNKKGAFIRDLGKDDFSVVENGRPQTIRYFSRQTDLPLTIGLMIDSSMSQRRVMDAERIASYTFLEQVLREKKDQVFIMQFDLSAILRQELTSSFLKLSEGLQRVDTPSMNDLRSQTGGGTMLYDAMFKASKEIMQGQTGRKALIVLSDGVDTGSQATIAETIEAAQRADTLIYSILFSDEGFYGIFSGGADGKNVLMRMSRETGGGFFEVSKKQSLDDIFTQLQEELRSQYSIGYESDQPVSISEWRKIQLTTHQKGLVIQARSRYWAQR
jgi:VWFA-related protein